MPTETVLDLDRATMQRLGRKVVDLIAGHLSTLREQPVYRTLGRREADALVAGDAPEAGEDFDALIETLEQNVLRYAVREPHPGFVAYVPGCPTFPAVLGDWIASGFNIFAGVWSVAAGPNAIELLVLDWFRRWIGMPEGSGGLLTTGGSNATLTAIVAARHGAVGGDPSLIAQLTLYTSDQAHSAVARAAWIAGFDRALVRTVATGDALTLDTAALEAAIAEDRARGLIPCAVVASAGTTNTGAVDPMHAIADLCAREGVWMHVDAAYGGFGALTTRGARLLDGLGRADSVTLDPHKWLFVPFECGCVLVREPRRLWETFHIYPDYLQDVSSPADQAVNFADYGEQLTRYSRALKVWLSVRYFGLSALRDAMDHGIDLAELAESLVRADPFLEVLSPAQLGICCFRAHPPDANDSAVLDALNERVNATVNASGRYFMSSTRLRGVFTLRVCVLGFRTTRADVTGLIEMIAQLARSGGVPIAAIG
ncbi:MAG: pyridoxal-dependent decarboxylase [Gemmatimonadaceae bacterium]